MRNLNVNLTFTANTEAAQAQVNKLQMTLNNLTSVAGLNNLGVKLQSSIMPGVQAASQLRAMLNASMQDGSLNIAKFNASLKSSETSIVSLGKQMMSLGPQGQQAFQQMSTAILQAQIPLTKTKTMLNSIWGTLINVAKWQLASNVLMGLVNGIKGAYEYAQDLNESLNNIRIITSYSVEEMDKFAKKANEAAKVLKSSTTAYTDAALIYYQQGLEGQAVLDRAETTIKLANVTSQAAEEVSDQMTAIWNNFYDGSRSIEYYADVITALGAATASSSDEIAQGLEKFSAVADTVGLSYEYATTALATVTAQTRQSADVVGTAFKTLFARIQDLELGNTLEDGTTLGQYSEALYKVGINIKDSSGNLKDMDNILNEMGAKWQQIDKDQQVALAKSVAGIRQYTQLIALMDNWDTFEVNLEVAEGAEGTLQKQQDIWAESWEAAQKRVQASAQGLYEGLISDDFFIDLNNIFAELIDGIKMMVDAMGGLKGLLPLLVAGIAQFVGPKIMVGLRGMSQEMAMTNKSAQEEILTLKELAIVTAGLTGNMSTTEQSMQLKTLDLRKQALNITRELTNEEQRQLNAAFDHLGTLQQITTELQNQSQIEKEKATNNLLDVGYRNVANTRGGGTHPVKITENDLNQAMENSFIKVGKKGYNIEDGIDKAVKTEDQIMGATDKTSFQRTQKQMSKAGYNTNAYEWDEQNNKVRIKEGQIGIAEQSAKDASAALKDQFNISPQSTSRSAKAVEEYAQGLVKSAQASNSATKGQKQFNAEAAKVEKTIKKLNKSSIGETFMKTTAAVGSLTMGLSSLVSGFKTLTSSIKEGNLTFETLLSVMTSLTMGLPMLIMGIKGFGSVLGITNAITAVATALEKSYTAEKTRLAVATALGITLKEGETFAETKRRSVQLAGLAAEKLANGEKSKGIALALSAKAAAILEAVGLGALIPAKYANATASGTAAAAEMAMLWPIGLLVLAIGGLIVVIALVVTAIKGMINAYNADAIAAEKAAKSAADLAETYNKVKQAYEELKKSIEDYQNAQDAIDKLKIGTQEWRDAVQEANEQVIALLDKYPELIKYVDTLEGGRMIIRDEGLAALKEKEAENVAIAQNMSQSANLTAKQLQNKAEQTELSRTVLTNKGNAFEVGLTAGALSSALPVLGSLSLITGTIAGLQEAEKEQKANDYIDQLSKRYQETGEEVFVNLEQELKNLGLKSEEAADKIKDLVREQDLLRQQEETIAKNQISNLLNAQSGFNSSGFTDNMNQIAADLMKDYENNYSVTANSLHDTAMFRGHIATDIGKTAFYDYMQKMGYDKSQLRKVDFKGKEIKFQTQDEAGGEWSDTKTLSYEALREAALQSYLAEHAEEMAQKMNALMDTTRQLSKSTNAYDQAMASFLNEGDLSLLDPETYNNLANYSSDELARIYEENKQVFKNAGFESSSELIDGFNEALNTYDPVEAAQNILERRWESFNNTIKTGAQELEVSEGVLRAYADTLIDENDALQENEDQAAKTAVAHYRLATNIKELRGVLADNAAVLKDNTANSIEQADALGAIKEMADKAFGVDISGDFLLQHLELLEKAVNGDTQAFKEFNKFLVEDFAKNLVIEDLGLKNALSNELSSIMNEVDDIEIGANLSLDNSQALEALNIALENGSTTVEEIEAMFANAGLQFDPGLVKTYKKPSKTVTSTKMTGTWNGTPIDATMTNTVASEVELPWIGDNPPKFETNETTGEITQIKGTGIIDSVDLTKTDTSTAYPDLLTYGTDDEKEKKKKNKELEAELDRYHEIDEILNDIQTKDEALAKIEERSFGAKKVAAMQARVKALDDQVKAYDRVIEEAKQYRDIDKANIEELGGIIDEKSGNIINFEEKQMEYITKLQNIANKDSDEYQKLHEEFELFNDYATKFEESQNKYEKTLDEQVELTKQILDKELEIIEYKIEIKLEINSREIEKIERQLSRLDDTPYSSADRMTLLQGKMGEEFENINNNKDSIRKVLEKAGVSKEDIDSYMAGDSTGLVEKYDLDENVKSALTTYTDSIIDSEQNIYDLSKEIPQVFSEAVASFHEEISSINEDLETQLGIVENYQNIVDLMGKEQLGLTDDDIKNMEKLQNQAASTQVKNAKANMDLTRNTLETVRQKIAEIEDKDSEAYKYWQEQEKALNKQLQEDTENFTSLWANAIQTAYDTFSAETQRAIDNFSDAIAGANFDSMEELQKAYEREVELSDRYIENYQQAYELSKLNRQINQDLNKTDNIKSQKMLRDLQKEIEDIQKSGKQLSEYELNALQKKYDLRLAEIALEDAQNAKSTVRLRRDSEGNFGYVYTANEAEIDKAQQNYEDKLYALQELNDNYLEQLSEQVISNRSAMLDELRELEKLYGKDSKKYKEEAAKVIEKYTDNEKYLLGQMQQVYSNNAEVRRLDLENYGTYQLQHISKSSDWVTSFNNTTLGMITGYDNIEKFQSDLNDKIGSPDEPGTLLGDFYIAYNTLEQRLEDVFEEAGVDVKQYRDDTGLYLGEQGATKIFTDFKNHITTAMNGQGGISENIGKAADATEDLRDRGDKALNDKSEGLAAKVQEFYNKYHPKMEGATEDAEDLDTALTNLIGQYDIKANVDGQKEIKELTEALRLLTAQIEASKKVLGEGNVTGNPSGQKPTVQNTSTKDPLIDYTPSTKAFTTKYYQGKRETDTGGQQVYLTDDAKGTTGGAWYDISFTDTTWDIARNARGAYAVHMAGYEAPWGEKVGTHNNSGEYTELLAHGTPSFKMYNKDGTGSLTVAGRNLNGVKFKIADDIIYEKDNIRFILVQAEQALGNQFDKGEQFYVVPGVANKWNSTKWHSFDTGGYTGSWGPEGRLAMLHQKEIVLNAHDTENLLTAVSMIREISDKLESNALAMRYLSAIGNYNAAINTNNHDTLQQEVTIHAEFPNATNHSEIEEAFDNLVNLASQYANRK